MVTSITAKESRYYLANAVVQHHSYSLFFLSYHQVRSYQILSQHSSFNIPVLQPQVSLFCIRTQHRGGLQQNLRILTDLKVIHSSTTSNGSHQKARYCSNMFPPARLKQLKIRTLLIC